MHRAFLFRFSRSNRGTALIEFAVVLPLLILVLAGIIEFGRYLLAHEKAINTSNTIAQYISQMPDTTSPGNMVNAVNTLIRPLDAGNVGYIVSNVTKAAPGAPLITKTLQTGGSIQGGMASKIGTPQGPNLSALEPVFLPNQTNLKRDEAIVVEIFYDYETIIPGVSGISRALDFNKQIYNYSLVLTRVYSKSLSGAATPMPGLYGCCGEYCKDEDVIPDVACRYCFSQFGRKPCALTPAAAVLHGIEECNPNCTPVPCDPADCLCTGTCPPIGG